jgi:hypothetical protein
MYEQGQLFVSGVQRYYLDEDEPSNDSGFKQIL